MHSSKKLKTVTVLKWFSPNKHNMYWNGELLLILVTAMATAQKQKWQCPHRTGDTLRHGISRQTSNISVPYDAADATFCSSVLLSVFGSVTYCTENTENRLWSGTGIFYSYTALGCSSANATQSPTLNLTLTLTLTPTVKLILILNLHLQKTLKKT